MALVAITTDLMVAPDAIEALWVSDEYEEIYSMVLASGQVLHFSAQDLTEAGKTLVKEIAFP